MNETRAKAGAILSARKVRELEDAGITVVTKERLEALERLYEAEQRLFYSDRMKDFKKAESDINAIFDILKAMDK